MRWHYVLATLVQIELAVFSSDWCWSSVQ